MEEKKLTKLLHQASIFLSNLERPDTKDLERRIDNALLDSPHVLEGDKQSIREYWTEARDE